MRLSTLLHFPLDVSGEHNNQIRLDPT